MECPRCGRRYDDSRKSCPYCGNGKQSKKIAQKQQKTQLFPEEEERILNNNDRRRRDRERREQLRKKKKRRQAIQRRNALLLLALIVVGLVAYGFIKKGSSKDSEPTPSPTTTALATEAPQATQTTKKVASKKNTKAETNVKDMSDDCTNFINKDKGIDVPYPNEMTKPGENNDKTQKSIKTDSGDAGMVISAERIGQDSDVNQLLNKYRDGIGVDSSDAYVDPEGEYYSLDFVRSGEVKHRFGIIKNGYHIYYDFTYDDDSEGASRYKDYISYIDDYMKKTISGTIDIEESDNDSDSYDDENEDSYSYDDDDDYDEDYE